MPKVTRPQQLRGRDLRCVSPQPIFGAFFRADTGERVCGGTPGCHPDASHEPVFEHNRFTPAPLLSDAEVAQRLGLVPVTSASADNATHNNGQQR